MNVFARHVLKTFVILYKLIALTFIFRVERYQTTIFILILHSSNESIIFILPIFNKEEASG